MQDLVQNVFFGSAVINSATVIKHDRKTTNLTNNVHPQHQVSLFNNESEMAQLCLPCNKLWWETTNM